MLTENDVTNNKNLDIAILNGNYNNIGKEKSRKSNVKIACREDKITNKSIKLTYIGPKILSFKNCLLLCKFFFKKTRK